MVSVAVLVASVVGIFVFDLGGSLGEPGPQASWAIEYAATAEANNGCEGFETGGTPNDNGNRCTVNLAPGSGDRIGITLTNGDTIDTEQLVLKVGDETITDLQSGDVVVESPGQRWEGGERLVVGEKGRQQADGSSGNIAYQSGDAVTLVWESDNGEKSVTLFEGEVP